MQACFSLIDLTLQRCTAAWLDTHTHRTHTWTHTHFPVCFHQLCNVVDVNWWEHGWVVFLCSDQALIDSFEMLTTPHYCPHLNQGVLYWAQTVPVQHLTAEKSSSISPILWSLQTSSLRHHLTENLMNLSISKGTINVPHGPWKLCFVHPKSPRPHPLCVLAQVDVVGVRSLAYTVNNRLSSGEVPGLVLGVFAEDRTV